VKVTECCDGDH